MRSASAATGQQRGGYNRSNGPHGHQQGHQQNARGGPHSNFGNNRNVTGGSGSGGYSAASSSNPQNHAITANSGQQDNGQRIQLANLIGRELLLTVESGGQSANGEPSTSSTSPSTIQGRLWCYDTTSGALVLQTPPSSFRIVRLASISSFTIVYPAAAPEPLSNTDIKTVDTARLKEREQVALRDESRRIAREPPPGVLPFAADIFDALGKTMPVRWTGKSIVVLDEVMVDPPYAPSSCRSENKNRLEWVQKVLQGERSKLEVGAPDMFGTAAAVGTTAAA